MVDLRPDQPEVMAMGRYTNNAGLIVACRTLGYLDDSMAILDPTYGKGVFYREWYPEGLVATDHHPLKSPDLDGGCDFRKLPWPAGQFDAIVFDGPYKLNGTPTEEVDERYGVDVPARWQDRMILMEEGIDALVPLTRTWFLMKCQDQVVSQEKRWQTRIFADRIEAHGFRLVDMLHIEGYRVQPPRKCPACKGKGTVPGEPQNDIPPHVCQRCDGVKKLRIQEHSRGNYSTMLVCRRNPG